MNASATIRASYIRQARMSIIEPARTSLQPRPACDEKLQSFVHVDYAQHRDRCNSVRSAESIVFDVEKNAEIRKAHIENTYLDLTDGTSFMEWEEDSPVRVRLKRMFTVFPYRDPIYLVAIIFLIGSIDLVINASFELLPHSTASASFETEETVAAPTTILIGSILFFIAGIFDTFGALNADRGTIGSTKLDPEHVKYRPALLGTPEFKWIPSWMKVWDLAMTNLAFQAGLVVLFGGVVFMFAGIVDFPGVVSEENPFFSSIVFGPQVIHGLLFFFANAMLAYSEQERWYKPKIADPDWQSAFLNTVGGFGFAMAGFFLFQGESAGGKGELNAAIAAMVGSWAFLIGSVIRCLAKTIAQLEELELYLQRQRNDPLVTNPEPERCWGGADINPQKASNPSEAQAHVNVKTAKDISREIERHEWDLRNARFRLNKLCWEISGIVCKEFCDVMNKRLP
ncbi:integral membrane protein [Stemphylium lycopersici]|nr:integral membrane protein [Stemphylium lycopersici]